MRQKILREVTFFMGLWILVYLALNVVRSLLQFRMYSSENPSVGLFAVIMSMEIVCFSFDAIATIKFVNFFCEFKKKNLDCLRITTCWDRWNYTVIMYGIVMINVLVALFRFVYIISYNTWFIRNKPAIEELIDGDGSSFGWTLL